MNEKNNVMEEKMMNENVNMNEMNSGVLDLANAMPHCPVILVLDTSHSMWGQGLTDMMVSLKAFYKTIADIQFLNAEVDIAAVSMGDNLCMLEDFTPLIEEGCLEYCIGSVHLIPVPGSVPKGAEDLWFIDGPRWERYDEGLFRLFGGDIRRGVRAYFQQQNDMLVRNKPTVVGHPDKIVMHNRDRYFTEDEPWYRDLALESIHLIKELGLICEINTRGIYKGRHADFYPGKWLIREMKQLRIPVIVSTDAHAPEDLLRTEGAYEFLQEIGYPDVLLNLPLAGT